MSIMSSDSLVSSRRRLVVPGPCVEITGHSVAVPSGGGAPLRKPTGQPTVQLIRDGDVVRAVEIVCGCGQKIRLKCVYEEGAK